MANITTRISLDRPLTNAEGDANFVNLNTEKLERDGSIPMTGSLKTPGITSNSNVDGLKVYNQNDELVATFGASNSQDLVVEGSINIGGSSNLNMGGGDITANNIFLSGSIVSSQLGSEYGISGDGDIFQAFTEINTAGQTVVTIDVILKLVTITGVFKVGNEIVGSTSGATGTITKIVGNDLYITPSDPEDSFRLGETITYASNSGVLSNIVNSSSFKANQKIKIFGASPLGSSEPAETTKAIASKNGEGTGFTYYYWTAQFNFVTGKIASVIAGGTSTNPVTNGTVHGEISTFNETNNISLKFNRFSAESGILIYRSTTDEVSTSKLIAILGPNELQLATSDIVYVDYGTYSNTEWSTKDIDGFYTEASNIIHFPLTGSEINLNGWVSGTVESVADNVSNQITLTSAYEFNTNNAITFVHDSTEGIQKFIDDQREAGIQSATLPNGTYYTSKIKVPSNFEIAGSGKRTIFKQLPWNYDYWEDAAYPNEKGNIFSALEAVPENITFRDLSIDGNFLNNSRHIQIPANYLINMSNGENINIVNARIVNSVGGGAYLYRVLYLRIQNSEFLNGGGVSYVGSDLSSIYAGQGEYLTITNNLFENFLSPVDVSVTQIGTVVGNTIRNCGSGLLVYASANLLSSPNLIMGPDREFIPGPDTMDSDYNSINISLQSGIDYKSPVMLYLSTGVPTYLASVDNNGVGGTGVVLTSEIKMLTKLINQETLTVDYTNASNGQPFINFVTPDVDAVNDEGRNNGYFQFRILGSAIPQIPSLSKLITDNSDTLVAGEQIMGLAYTISATTYMFTDVDERILINTSLMSTDTVDGDIITIELKDSDNYTKFIAGNETVIGDVVKIFDHSSAPDITNQEFIVKSVTSNSLVLSVPESFTVPVDPQPGTDGHITIRKTFIIAKGRIV